MCIDYIFAKNFKCQYIPGCLCVMLHCLRIRCEVFSRAFFLLTTTLTVPSVHSFCCGFGSGVTGARSSVGQVVFSFRFSAAVRLSRWSVTMGADPRGPPYRARHPRTSERLNAQIYCGYGNLVAQYTDLPLASCFERLNTHTYCERCNERSSTPCTVNVVSASHYVTLLGTWCFPWAVQFTTWHAASTLP